MIPTSTRDASIDFIDGITNRVSDQFNLRAQHTNKNLWIKFNAEFWDFDPTDCIMITDEFWDTGFKFIRFFTQALFQQTEGLICEFRIR